MAGNSTTVGHPLVGIRSNHDHKNIFFTQTEFVLSIFNIILDITSALQQFKRRRRERQLVRRPSYRKILTELGGHTNMISGKMDHG